MNEEKREKGKRRNLDVMHSLGSGDSTFEIFKRLYVYGCTCTLLVYLSAHLRSWNSDRRIRKNNLQNVQISVNKNVKATS